MFLTTIHFPDTCDEAISYYKKVLGAEVKEIAYLNLTGVEPMRLEFL